MCEAGGAAGRKFGLQALWLDKNVAVCVDGLSKDGSVSTGPLTAYHFWPRSDAWEDLKADLEQRKWMAQEDVVDILNQTTELINFWQDEAQNGVTVDKAKEKFPAIRFVN